MKNRIISILSVICTMETLRIATGVPWMNLEPGGRQMTFDDYGGAK